MDIFDIRLLGFGQDSGRDPASDLARAFGVDREKAAAIVARVPVIVKRGLDERSAEKFFHVLRGIGADVRIERRLAPSTRPPADGPAATSSPTSSPTSSTAAPALAPSHPAPSLPAPSLPAPQTSPPAGLGGGPADTTTATGAFLPRLLGAITYPFQKSAAPVYVGVALISTLMSYVFIIGPFIALAVQAIFYSQVLRIAASGRDGLPTGGEFTTLWDMISPAFRFIFAMLVPFVPAVAVVVGLPADNPAFLPAIVAATVAGLAYMPASVILASITEGCLGPLNPIAGIMMIHRVPLAYTMTTLAVGAFLLVSGLLLGPAAKLADSLPIPFLPTLVVNVVNIVTTSIAFRMLGVFLHHHEPELGLGL